MFVSVAIDLALDKLFTYSVPEEYKEKLLVGQLLRVSFSHRITRGFALALYKEMPPELKNLDPSKIKPIIGIEDESPFFSEAGLKLVKWIASYTASPIETALRTALPASVLKPSMKPKEMLFVEVVSKPKSQEKLTSRQQELYDNIKRVGGGWLSQVTREFKTAISTLRNLEEKGYLSIQTHVSRRDPLARRNIIPTKPLTLNSMQAKALETISSSKKPVLLCGVTGSGKTEVYLQAISREIEEGRGAIVLVPEISLTPQTVRRFAGRFGNKVAVLHSALSDGERYDEWHRIRTGEARVVVGPRSAVFAPIRNLGLIVVDEEHDNSYKQDETPRYNARDVAVVRAMYENAKVVLGSATPSLESWYNMQIGKYELSSLPLRAAGQSMPSVHVVNLEEEIQKLGHVPIFSSVLIDAIYDRISKGEQSILFLNRRGFSRVMQCPACGWQAECPNCSVTYTYHKVDQCLRCHICGKWEHIPKICPSCQSTTFDFTGIGTQRAEDALKACFKGARILRMDADSTSRKYSHEDILDKFRTGKADILLGTQMITKGLDFPNVTLVGVLNADTSLNMPDPRASERTYQLLAQVSGRAGRAQKPGKVIIQTFSPDEPAISYISSNKDFKSFAEEELRARKSAYLPPYCKMARIVFRSQSQELVESWSSLYAESLKSYAKKANEQTKNLEKPFLVGDAVESPLSKADKYFRYHIIMRAGSALMMTNAYNWIKSLRPPPDDVRISYDVDALTLM